MKEEEVAKLGELARIPEEMMGLLGFFSAVLRSLLCVCVVGAKAGARRYRAVRSRGTLYDRRSQLGSGDNRARSGSNWGADGVSRLLISLLGGRQLFLSILGMILGPVGGSFAALRSPASQCVRQYPW